MADTDEKKPRWKVSGINDDDCYFDDLDVALEAIKVEVTEGRDCDGFDVGIERVDMTDAEFAALPEL